MIEIGVQLPRPLSDEVQIELCVEIAVEIVLGNELLQRDEHRLVETANLHGAEHRDTSTRQSGQTTNSAPARICPLRQLRGRRAGLRGCRRVRGRCGHGPQLL